MRKQRLTALLLCIAMVLCQMPAALAKNAVNVTLDPMATSPFGAFQGWGTSLCWWGVTMGDLPPEERRALVAAFFDEEEGLGLNIARYNIGGGDDPTHNHLRKDDGREVPGWRDANGNWDYTADQNQINILQDAVACGADIIEAFSNSPPYDMTVSGCVSGGQDPNKTNLSPERFREFAAYLTDVVRYLQDECGVEIDTLEPMNEPNTDYWSYGGWQEGCHVSAEHHSALILAVKRALEERDLHNVRVSAADETSVDRMADNLAVYSEAAIDALGQINTHSYWASENGYRRLREGAAALGKPLYMTEVDGDRSIGTNAGNMGPALWFSQKIATDFHIMSPAAWVCWQVTGPAYPGSHRDSGYWYLSQYDKEAHRLDLFKKYYAYAHYTKFIRPGDYIVGSDAENVLAAQNRETGSIAIVVTNSGKSDETYTFDLSAFDGAGTEVAAYRTDTERDLEPIIDGVMETGVLTVQVPQNTITTYVVSRKEPRAVLLDGMAIRAEQGAPSMFVGDTVTFTAEAAVENPSFTWTVTDESGATLPLENGAFTAERGGIFTVRAALNGAEVSAARTVHVVEEDALVRLVNVQSRFALQAGEEMTQEGNNDYSAQYWRMARRGDVATFVNLRTGEALCEVEGRLTCAPLDGSDAQLWRITLHDGGYAIENEASKRALDVWNGSRSEGSRVDLYAFGGGANQLWYFDIAPRAEVLEPLFEATYSDAEILEPYGSDPYMGNRDVDCDKVFDNNPDTFFDSYNAIGYVGAKIAPTAITRLTFRPRAGYTARMIDGVFYGVREDGEKVALAELETEPPEGETVLYLNNSETFTEIRYESADRGHANLAELSVANVPFLIHATLGDALTIQVDNYHDAAELRLVVAYQKDGRLAHLTQAYTAIDAQSRAHLTEKLEDGFDAAIVYLQHEGTPLYQGYISFVKN